MKRIGASGNTADFETGSYRDPSGFVFYRKNKPYRQINRVYSSQYQYLMSSGLYRQLVDKSWLIPHTEVGVENALYDEAFQVIKPDLVPFISYPYGWCFSQLKDAALTMLEIQNMALEYGMTLKDASAYNMQFLNGRPLLIDTLSFEKWKPGLPWVAYRQFCQHFLAPLALAAYVDIRLSKLLRPYIDGIPLDLTSKLLPAVSWFNPGIVLHLHMHAKSQQAYGSKVIKSQKSLSMSYAGMKGLIDNLRATVAGLSWKFSPKDTEWGDYYRQTNYSKLAFDHKKSVVAEMITQVSPKTVWDLGANDGEFSRIASGMGAYTVAFDVDPVAVEKNYLTCKAENETALLPMIVDLTNPSPSIGWAHRERKSLIERGPVDLVMALALVHHLCIGNNIPLAYLARFLADIGKYVILEFVPKTDSQVKKLLASREDVFTGYTLHHCLDAFTQYFEVKARVKITGSQRSLIFFKRKHAL
jgi:hypothetical protein